MDTPTTSQKRIDANRRNAMRSTGPRTVEGKEKSRRNSLVHGLAGAGVVLPQDQEQAVRERAEQWNSSLRPMNAFEMSLVETIAVESLRIERCRVEERLARDNRGRRAVSCWGDERKAETARIARGLERRPAEVAARLSINAPGCDWMIDRWRALGHALDKNGTWTDEQVTLALDLLGVDHTLRELHTPLDPADDSSTLDHRQELIDDQLERLLDRKDSSLDDIEEDERQATILGFSTGDDRVLVLLRRYETASFRRMKWALDLMHKGRSRPNNPVPDPKWDDNAPASRSPYPTREEIEKYQLRKEQAEAERSQPAHASARVKVIPTHPRLADLLQNEPNAKVARAVPSTPRSRVEARQIANRNARLLRELSQTRRNRPSQAVAV
ncbi:hypothetical protein EP7_004483 [Isosphaeraceae bacterium EP7]